jgi:hypothetical protein
VTLLTDFKMHQRDPHSGTPLSAMHLAARAAQRDLDTITDLRAPIAGFEG